MRAKKYLLLTFSSLLYLTTVAVPASAAPEALQQILIPEGEPAPQRIDLQALQLGRVDLLAFSHQGTTLASSSPEGGLCLWELSTGRPRRCFATGDTTRSSVTTLAFDAHDTWIATGRTDGSVALWQLAGAPTPPPSCQLAPLPDMQLLGRFSSFLSFTPAGSLLSVGSRNGTVRSCPQTAALPDGMAPTSAAAPIAGPELAGLPSSLFEKTAGEPSGQLLAVATRSGLGVWKLRSGERQWFQPVPSLVMSLAMSADGKRLAAGLLNGGIFLWEVGTGNKLPLHDQPGSPVKSVAFSNQGDKLAAGSEDRLVSLWDTQSRRHLRDFPQSGGCTALAFRPDGAVLGTAAEGSGITLWEIDTGNAVQTLRGNADWIRSIAFNPAGTRMATASDDQQVRIWQKSPAAAAGPEWSLRCSTGALEAGAIRSVAFSPPNGQHVAVAMDSPVVRLINPETCDSSAQLPGLKDWIKSVAYSPDGRRLAAASDDGSVGIWDLDTNKPPRLLRGHRDAVKSLVFSPRDGSMLATVAFDKTARLWQSTTGQLIHTFDDQATRGGAIAISADGTTLALGLEKGVALWDVDSKRRLGTLDHERAVTAVRFSADGRLLATVSEDGRVRLWDAHTWQLRFALPEEGERSRVLAIDFFPDRELLAVATLGQVTLWDLAQQKVYAELRQGEPGWAYLALNHPDARLFRHETGGLLWRRTTGGGLESILPPLPPLAPQIDLKVHFKPAERSGAQLGTITAVISSTVGSGPVYWLRLEGIDLPERTDLQEKISMVAPPVQLELLPGQRIERTFSIMARQPGFLPPRDVRFCLKLHHAHDGQDRASCQDLGQEVVLPLGPWWWRYASELVFGGAFLAAIVFAFSLLKKRRRVLSHPVVYKTLAGYDSLHDVTLRELPEVDRALRQAEKIHRARGVRKRALRAAGISENSWELVVAAMVSIPACATRFAERLAATLTTPRQPLHESADLTAFRLTLPPLSINIPAQSVLVIGGDAAADAQTVAAHFSSAQLGFPEVVFFVDLTLTPTPPVDAKKVLEDTHPGTTFVVIAEEVLRRILLAKDARHAQEALLEAIVAQYPLEQIVPYQEGSNELKDEQGCFFFGRQSELELMLGQYSHNFLLVGPRFMGKSSLLNALHRELSRRYPHVKVIKYQLFSDSLIPHLSQDAAFRGGSPEDFYSWVMQRSQEHQLFLLDETDKFLEKESASQFRFCSVMRALSGQGRASFILAGHQKLHEATRTPDHPLRNFGQLIRLGPLDRSSAEQMIVDPMTALGLRFLDRAGMVDWLAQVTGCRPHLLARACLSIVRLGQPSLSTPIGLEEIQHKVLSCSRVRADFESWENGKVDPLDRALTRAALLLDRPQRTDLVKYLSARGVHPSADMLEQSLSRLYAWHYALIGDAQDRLDCPVPLFRHWLTDPRPEFPRGKQWNSSAERLAEELENDLAELRSTTDKTWRATG